MSSRVSGGEWVLPFEIGELCEAAIRGVTGSYVSHSSTCRHTSAGVTGWRTTTGLTDRQTDRLRRSRRRLCHRHDARTTGRQRFGAIFARSSSNQRVTMIIEVRGLWPAFLTITKRFPSAVTS